MAQLVERSPPTSKIRSSNPTIDKKILLRDFSPITTFIQSMLVISFTDPTACTALSYIFLKNLICQFLRSKGFLNFSSDNIFTFKPLSGHSSLNQLGNHCPTCCDVFRQSFPHARYCLRTAKNNFDCFYVVPSTRF